MNRKIIHIDMDAFYASVEQRDNPNLAGKPVVIGGRPDLRGVVSTASYEARRYSIKSAMSTAKAVKLCPDIIIIPPNLKKYKEASVKSFNIYREYSDIIEPLALDECFLDITENKKNITSATIIAKEIQERVYEELKLTVSIGVSVNKLLAKIASNYNKPRGLCVIKPDDIDGFMRDLSVKEIFGVGKVTLKKMDALNIKTCGDLQNISLVDLIKHFGTLGECLYSYCRGIDDRPVVTERDSKSFGSECTFPCDSSDLRLIKEKLYNEVMTAHERMKKNGYKAKTITVKIKYYDFKLITRSKSLSYYTDDFPVIYNICLDLLLRIGTDKKKIRLIGVSLSNLIEAHKDIELNFY